MEGGVAEAEHAPVPGHQPVAAAVGRGRHADDGLVDPGVAQRAVEGGVAEGEHAPAGADQPVTPPRRCAGHARGGAGGAAEGTGGPVGEDLAPHGRDAVAAGLSCGRGRRQRHRHRDRRRGRGRRRAAGAHEVLGDEDRPVGDGHGHADVGVGRVDEVLVVVRAGDEGVVDRLDRRAHAHVLPQRLPVRGRLAGQVGVVGDGARRGHVVGPAAGDAVEGGVHRQRTQALAGPELVEQRDELGRVGGGIGAHGRCGEAEGDGRQGDDGEELDDEPHGLGPPWWLQRARRPCSVARRP